MQRAQRAAIVAIGDTRDQKRVVLAQRDGGRSPQVRDQGLERRQDVCALSVGIPSAWRRVT